MKRMFYFSVLLFFVFVFILLNLAPAYAVIEVKLSVGEETTIIEHGFPHFMIPFPGRGIYPRTTYLLAGERIITEDESYYILISWWFSNNSLWKTLIPSNIAIIGISRTRYFEIEGRNPGKCLIAAVSHDNKITGIYNIEVIKPDSDRESPSGEEIESTETEEIK